MRIAWVTPLSRGCGISKYSLAVIPSLASRADVEVWAPPAADDYPCPATPLRKLRVDDATVAALAEYDLVVYNTGNNPAFHTEIHRMSERLPGVVVIHDKRMHGFFFDLWAVIDRDPSRYAWMMRHYYGDAGEAASEDVLMSRAGVDDRVEFPLVEPALWNATGIVAHSAEAARLVSRYGNLVPLISLGLPFDLSTIPDSDMLPSRAKLLPDDNGRVLLVSSGGVFEQKRLDSVLRALAYREDLRGHALLAIVGGGRPEYLERLRRLVRELELDDSVILTGYVDDRRMYGWLNAADIAVNLRYPSMESASLSLIEQLSFGTPVVVSDTSSYSELPSEVAVKIPVDQSEVPTLAKALSRLVRDANLRTRMGRAAMAFSAEAHSSEAYADRFLSFAEKVVAQGGVPS